jgi:activator of 2-hydroxyglutaryl-CoA dehydratase
MIAAGLDVGVRATKVILLDERRILSRSCKLTGFDQKGWLSQGLDEALKHAGVGIEKVEATIATGVGRKAVPFATMKISEVTADARGRTTSFPLPERGRSRESPCDQV